MSSSRALPWEAASAEPPQAGARRAAVFVYPAARDERERAPADTALAEPAARPAAADRPPLPAVSLETAAFERGREQGRAEAQAEWQTRLRGQAAADVAAERAAIGMVVGAFARARAGYFVQVEGEVVRLALAIARRILRRESQLDPLLLRGAVRLALERLDQQTKVTLRVPPGRAEAWRQALSPPRALPPGAQAPAVAEDPALSLEECVLETSLGETRCAVEDQLREIEQGFFDLLADRGEQLAGPPAPASEAAPAPALAAAAS